MESEFFPILIIIAQKFTLETVNLPSHNTIPSDKWIHVVLVYLKIVLQKIVPLFQTPLARLAVDPFCTVFFLQVTQLGSVREK